jgi:hypothetical protein
MRVLRRRFVVIIEERVNNCDLPVNNLSTREVSDGRPGRKTVL